MDQSDTQASTQVIDESVFEGLSALKADPARWHLLMHRALTQCREFVETISNAALHGDMDACGKAVHALYGCAGSAGFVEVIALCDGFRALATAQKQNGAAQFASDLRDACAALEHHIAKR